MPTEVPEIQLDDQWLEDIEGDLGTDLAKDDGVDTRQSQGTHIEILKAFNLPGRTAPKWKQIHFKTNC